MLHGDPKARRYRGTSGLYHFAILVPDRRELARVVARLIRARHPNFPTDHVMTKNNQGVMRRFRMAMVSAGGYHHHIGLNTWQGEGAPCAPADAVGLRWFSVVLPHEEALETVLGRVRAAGVPLEAHGPGWLVRDPFGNGVALTSRPGPGQTDTGN